jgi:hypothetical protein
VGYDAAMKRNNKIISGGLIGGGIACLCLSPFMAYSILIVSEGSWGVMFGVFLAMLLSWPASQLFGPWEFELSSCLWLALLGFVQWGSFGILVGAMIASLRVLSVPMAKAPDSTGAKP